MLTQEISSLADEFRIRYNARYDKTIKALECWSFNNKGGHYWLVDGTCSHCLTYKVFWYGLSNEDVDEAFREKDRRNDSSRNTREHSQEGEDYRF